MKKPIFLSLILFLGFDQLKAGAISGTLDLSFGGNNTGYTIFDGNNIQWTSVAITPSGNIVVAGIDSTKGIVAQYKPDGTLDQSFGDHNGYTLLIAANSGTIEFNSIAITPSGNIVVAGSYNDNGIIAQYTSTGMLDESFGSGSGYVIFHDTSNTGKWVNWKSVTITPSGNIVVAGLYGANGIVAQYTSTGTLNKSFGNGAGYVTFNSTYWTSVTIMDSGNIIVAGIESDKGIIAQYTSTGMLDESFGNGAGYVAFEDVDFLTGWNLVTITQDNNIIVAGYDSSNNYDGIIARYTLTGALDTTYFGSGAGFIKFNQKSEQDSYWNSAAITKSGNIVVVGEDDTNTVKGIIAQYKPDGTLDTTGFNADSATPGSILFTIQGTIITWKSVAITAGGNIVVVGQSGSDAIVARYFGSHPNTPMGFVEKYSGIDLGFIGGIAKVN